MVSRESSEAAEARRGESGKGADWLCLQGSTLYLFDLIIHSAVARNFSIAPEEFYHVYNRGTDKRRIFTSVSDHERFLALLYLCNSEHSVDMKLQGSTLYELLEQPRGETLVDISTYCLMPNHFHLIVKEKTDGGLSKFMQKLTTGYTMYFNKRYDRSGSLFQGRFKVSHIDTDRYLSYLISYVHLNPVKIFEPTWKETGISNRTGAQAFLGNYPYSSYCDYLGEQRPERAILNTESLPDYFSTGADFERAVADWLTYKPE